MRPAFSLALSFALATTAFAQPAAPPPEPPKTMQWLYASAEARALDRATFEALVRYAVDMQARRMWGGEAEGVVLASASTPEAPAWQRCAPGTPAAVIFDIDETLLLNTGWNRDSARRGDPSFGSPNAGSWLAWETTGAKSVEPVPGAVEAVRALKAANIGVFFVSNRDRHDKAGKDIADATRDALRAGGFGDALTSDNVLLSGDFDTAATHTSKDLRRAHIAETHCVIAMGGDQLGDFSDLFNKRNDKEIPIADRRKLADSPAIMQKLGRGWFLLPNPVYGPGVKGSYGDLFTTKEWPDSAAARK